MLLISVCDAEAPLKSVMSSSARANQEGRCLAFSWALCEARCEKMELWVLSERRLVFNVTTGSVGPPQITAVSTLQSVVRPQ